MDSFQIIGIILVQNEDRFLDRVLWNISDFCDRIYIADHRSTDDTQAIARRFCRKHPAASYQKIHHPRESHDLIKNYAGKHAWIFGVDGDELYERNRLKKIRSDLLSGKHDHCWMLLGNVLNCLELDMEEGIASGYLAPPCRSMTKLYNFRAIESWDGDCPERLHGGTITFRPGYHEGVRCDLYKEISWEDALFRCLHLCFMQRSSKERRRAAGVTIRRNIADRNAESMLVRIANKFFRTKRTENLSLIKKNKYMRGEVATKDVKDFFSLLSQNMEKNSPRTQ